MMVVFSKKVEDYFFNLVEILYHKNYFSYCENAETYVQTTRKDIENNIETKSHFLSPKLLLKYGKYYCFVKGSKRTTWYIFFDKKDTRYLIKFISNNHVAKASLINRLK